MKKRLIIIFFGLVFAAAALGTGIFLAEKKIRSDVKNTASGLKIIKNENTAPVKADIPAAEEQENISETQDVNAQTENNKTDEPIRAEEKFSFAIIGDTQSFDSNDSAGGIQKSASFIKKQGANLIFSLGDIVSSCDGKSGCEGKMNSWKSILGPLFSKTYATMGNHDRTGGNKSDGLWQNFFNFPNNGPSGFSELVYSLDGQNSHFVVLDSEKPEEHIVNKIQRDWLEQDLTKNKKENIFVFFHEPAYPLKHKIGSSLDVNPGERNALWDIFVKYKVTAVFSGHEHITSRKKINGVYQFGFGNTDSFDHELPDPGTAEYAYRGKSFGIVEIDGKKITVKTYSVDGQVLNSFNMAD
jgi:3',5'-cyclic-AMP phosphodiesterase